MRIWFWTLSIGALVCIPAHAQELDAGVDDELDTLSEESSESTDAAESAPDPQPQILPTEKEQPAAASRETKTEKEAAAPLDLTLEPRQKPVSKKPPTSIPERSSDYQLEDTTVLGQRRTEATAAARYDLKIGNLRVVPRKSAAEQLMLAPGVLTTNAGGEGHAHETYMRGFASGEGQDIEFLVDGVPLNEVSNPHNHGYADLYFILPEVVQSVSVTEGAFDPEQGDFAFAGTAEYRLGVSERGAQVRYSLGLRNTQRVSALYAPPEEEDGTFAAFEYYTTDGYGENRAAERVSALGRFSDDWGKHNFKYSISAYGYAARYDQAGVIRQDDYEDGTIGFYDTYDSNQGGESNRFLLSLNTVAGPSHSCFDQTLFIGWRTLRIRTNFTGWLTDSTVDENGDILEAQRGDGLEMRYKVLTGGSRGSYTLSKLLFGQKQDLSLGYTIRFDQGESEQFRIRSITAIPYKTVFDNDFTIMNIAGWLRLQLRPLPRLAVRGGLRIDGFSFGVTDNNQADADREGTRVSNQTSQSFGYALNPRVTADVRLFKELHALVSYGQGTRSTDAAALSDNETAPFARAQELDAGFSFAHGKPGAAFGLSSQLSYSFTKVNKDMVFSETEGRNVLVGASTRHAVLFGSRARLFSLADLSANVGWTHATLDETGELMPYIPRLVVRVDAAVFGNIANWKLLSVPVGGRFGVGFTYVPGRPLPLDETGDSMCLLSAGADVRLWYFSLGVEMRNLLNLKYRQAEFNYASNFVSADATASKVPERHFVAGEPFFVMGTLTWHIEDMIRSIGTKSRGEPQGKEPSSPSTPSTPLENTQNQERIKI